MENAHVQSTSRIERFGLEAIPKELKTNTWLDYFTIQFSFMVNSGNFLVPAFAVLYGQLSFAWALTSTTLGACLAYFLVSITALPGARYGIPGQYAIRSILGVKGSQYITSPIRTFTSIYWFAVQTVAGATILQHLLYVTLSISIPFLALALALGLLMSILALVGFEAVKNFTRLFIPLLIIGIFSMIYVYIRPSESTLNFSYVWESPQASNSIGAFLTFMSLAFVQHISTLPSSSDFTRYARSQRDGFWGLFLGNTVGFVTSAFIATYAAVSTESWNAVVTASELSGSLLLVLIINISALIAIVNVNLLNSYTGSFSLLNIFPTLGRVKSSILLGIFSIGFSCFPEIVQEAKIYVSLLGSLIAPVSGVIIADLLLLKKGRLEQELLSESAKFNYNQAAIISSIIGVVLYAVIPETISPGLVTFLISSLLYLGLNYVHRNYKQTLSYTKE